VLLNSPPVPVLVPIPNEFDPNPVLDNPPPNENVFPGVPNVLVFPPPNVFPNEGVVPLVPKFSVGAEVVVVKVKLVPVVEPAIIYLIVKTLEIQKAKQENSYRMMVEMLEVGKRTVL